jgi:hypothetical protein
MGHEGGFMGSFKGIMGREGGSWPTMKGLTGWTPLMGIRGHIDIHETPHMAHETPHMAHETPPHGWP